MKRNQIDVVIIHSGALNRYFILPTILVFKEFKNIPIIEVMHRPLASWGVPFGIDKVIAVSQYVASKQKKEYRFTANDRPVIHHCNTPHRN